MRDEIENGKKTPRFCVFTTLIGQYEQLNEQPIAAQSSIPFVCLTDDLDLKSESWKIRHVSPMFSMDPFRSQRDLKLRPHIHLPDFDFSLYIDNCVILSSPPEVLFEQHLPPSGILLVHQSSQFGETVLDEFIQVSTLGYDDQSRIFEQLNHYTIDCPDILQERGYWSGLMLRDHHNARVRAMLEIWFAHVQRYSRRDQLSLNTALQKAELKPDLLDIDIFHSQFHSWPHSIGRDRSKSGRNPSLLLNSPSVRIRQLEQVVSAQEQKLAQDRRLIKLAAETRAIAGVSNITFGGALRLIQMSMFKETGHLVIALSWREDKNPHLAKWVGVHIINESGQIVGQADYSLKECKPSRAVEWRDFVVLSDHQLRDAKSIGIVVFDDPEHTFPVKGGRCDWNNHRLLIPLQGC